MPSVYLGLGQEDSLFGHKITMDLKRMINEIVEGKMPQSKKLTQQAKRDWGQKFGRRGSDRPTGALLRGFPR
jgi:hypothetical protein